MESTIRPVCYAFSKTGDLAEGRSTRVELLCLPAVAEVPAVENATLVWSSLPGRGFGYIRSSKRKERTGWYINEKKRGRTARQGRRKVRKGQCEDRDAPSDPLKWPSSATVELEAREAASEGVTL